MVIVDIGVDVVAVFEVEHIEDMEDRGHAIIVENYDTSELSVLSFSKIHPKDMLIQIQHHGLRYLFLPHMMI